jgi:hypothetical protein
MSFLVCSCQNCNDSTHVAFVKKSSFAERLLADFSSVYGPLDKAAWRAVPYSPPRALTLALLSIKVRIILWCLSFKAAWRALPYFPPWLLTSTSFVSKSGWTTSVCPFSAAHNNGVRPSLSFASWFLLFHTAGRMFPSPKMAARCVATTLRGAILLESEYALELTPLFSSRWRLQKHDDT